MQKHINDMKQTTFRLSSALTVTFIIKHTLSVFAVNFP